MSERTNEEELEERLYNKLVAKFQDKLDVGGNVVKSQINQIDERVEKMEKLSNTINNANHPAWLCFGSGVPVTHNKTALLPITASEETHHEEEELEERLFKKLVAKIQDELDMGNGKSQIKKADKHVDSTRSSTTINDDNTCTWFCIGSGAVSANTPSDDDPSIFQLSEDLYSILATASWSSFPFWISMLVIFVFQYFLVILLLDNQFNINSDDNPLNLPANVENSVHISQVLLIAIALFSQQDLLAGIESIARGFPDDFCGDSRFVSMTGIQWRLSSIIRFIQGVLNFLASFVLAVQSETVSDVLLNVLGVAFISDLDEIAFGLCTKGYFGGSMKRISRDICEARFHRANTDIRTSMPIVMRKSKKDAHIISAFAAFVVGIVAFTYLAIRQNNGVYAEQDIRIEFGDEVLPFLGLFNGCYRTSESSERIGGRLVYEQVGYPSGGKFGFCSDFGEGDGGWTFFIGEQDDICERKSYILRSGDTSTFSLLEAGETEWYTYDDLPMDYLQITETKPTTECGQSIFESTKGACPSILAFDAMSMTKLPPPVNEVRSERSLDAAFSHPIYFSNNTENGSFTLVFFTGRRWIMTKSDRIEGLGNESSVLEIEDFFFSNNHGLFKFIDQLRTSLNEEAGLVSAVSEIVDTVRDQGSPLGLLWYLPRYEEKITSMTETETDKLQRNFPSANLARPIDSVWTCLVCNDDTNPCLNEGICNTDKGTCECKHGWTGELCQEPPLRNGICNLYFNSAEYNYDWGDCCAGTCKGEDCGKDDLPDPFMGISPDANNVDESGNFYPFRNRTEEWNQTFREREFAYGINIGFSGESLGIFLSDPPPRRFNHCIDPNTALLTIEQTEFILGLADSTIRLPRTTVRCNGSIYLQTPSIDIANNSNRSNQIFKEEVRVSYGARCEFTFGFSSGTNKILISAENQSVPFLQQGFEFDRIIFNRRIPESECVWDTFVENLIPLMPDNEYEEFTGGVDLDAMCTQDRGELLDRYAVWKILKGVIPNDGDLPQRLNGHVCDLTWTSSTVVLCTNSRRVSDLAVRVTSIPSEIGILTTLTTLAASNDDGNLTLSLPTEIGRLRSLEWLNLSNNQLTSIPPELWNLTSLERLDLSDNQLTSIPSEIGHLTSLTSLRLSENQLTSIPSEIGNFSLLGCLDLRYNPMTWDSLPVEVQDLESEGTQIIQIGRDDGEDGCL